MRSDNLRPPPIARPDTTFCWENWCRWPGTRCDNGIEQFESARLLASNCPTAESSVAVAEKAYAAAERLHRHGDATAIDYWARAIAWVDDAALRDGGNACRSPHDSGCNGCDAPECRASRVRDSATVRILSFGQDYGRLDPSSHLLIHGRSRMHRIPVEHQGFAWNQDDFNRLLVFSPPVGVPGNVCGAGVPLVVLTAKKVDADSSTSDCCCTSDSCGLDCSSFLFSRTPFAATALIRLPVSMFCESNGCETENCEATDRASFTLVNPLQIDRADSFAGVAQSPAMPVLFARQSSQFNPITAFLGRGNGIDRPELRFFEPYQADKIPLILVHGLISDPSAFLDMADVVRADPLLRRRYQIWIFRYPTSDAFLASAAALRQQLAKAFACHESTTLPNPRAVIVGHSMGGLLSKLQVTESGDRLWNSIANVPLERLRGSPKNIAELRRSFFFRSSPHIGRVVYIATPHQGSPWASRGIGRLGASLARWGTSYDEGYDEILAQNPGVFSGQFARAVPTSVDLLRPDSQLLQSLASTPSSPDVVVNSIIGNYIPLPRAGASDAVVPVTSAYRREAESTATVAASHTSILLSRQAQQELVRILMQHLQTSAECNVVDDVIPNMTESLDRPVVSGLSRSRVASRDGCRRPAGRTRDVRSAQAPPRP